MPKYSANLVVFIVATALSAWSLAESPAKPATEHPLLPVIELASKAIERMDRDVKDYKCMLMKREQIDGALSPYQIMEMKLRHAQKPESETPIPFSVYLIFLKPASAKGREVLFVDGRRGGDMLVRRGGSGLLSDITVRLSTTGRRALEESKYPLNDVGIRNLIVRLLEVMEKELKYNECEVTFFDDAKLDGRDCQHVQVTHPEKRDHFQYNLARVFIDKELQLPVYFASYDWPTAEGETPALVEEFIYTKVELNPGLTDKDFESTNPEYKFEDETKPPPTQSLETK